MADDFPGRSVFSADEEKAMRQFSPQGPTGGGVNIPGRLNNGKPAVLRSESTERARANADAGAMGVTRPASVLQGLINPQGAAVHDAIYADQRRKIDETGPEE